MSLRTQKPKRRLYKVSYSGTRHFNTYSSKKAALDQARYARRRRSA